LKFIVVVHRVVASRARFEPAFDPAGDSETNGNWRRRNVE
jgi:hypothetical protein